MTVCTLLSQTKVTQSYYKYKNTIKITNHTTRTCIICTGGAVSKAFGSKRGGYSNRQTYIIDPDGNIRYIFTKVSGRIYDHSSDVLAKLNELIKT